MRNVKVSIKIEKVSNRVTSGSSPHWDETTNCLYFVDLYTQTIHRLDTETKRHTQATIAPGGKDISFIIPIENVPHNFIVSMNNELVQILWDGEKETAAVVCVLATLPNNDPKIIEVWNDAKCDATGQLWAFTICRPADLTREQATTEKKFIDKGKLYCFGQDRKLKVHLTEMAVSNGICIDHKRKKFYSLECKHGEIFVRDFNINATPALTKRDCLFCFEDHSMPGESNGLAIDRDGKLWAASLKDGLVMKLDPKHPDTMLATLPLKTRMLSAMTFGGKNLDELYITTAATPPGYKKACPDDGVTVKLTGTRSKGFPDIPFKL